MQLYEIDFLQHYLLHPGDAAEDLYPGDIGVVVGTMLGQNPVLKLDDLTLVPFLSIDTYNDVNYGSVQLLMVIIPRYGINTDGGYQYTAMVRYFYLFILLFTLIQVYDPDNDVYSNDISIQFYPFDPPTPVPNPALCLAWGDPHWVRWGTGDMFNFQGFGEYVLAKVGDYFEVQNRQVPCNTGVMCNAAVCSRVRRW